MKIEEIDEEMITKYLLGELSEDDREGLEEQYFADDKLYEEIRATERTLIDTYVQGKLTGREHQRFESYFMSSPSRRQKVELARSFNKYISELEPVGQKTPWWKSLAAFLGIQYPFRLNHAMRLSAAMAVVVILTGTSWLAFESVRLRNEIAQNRGQRATQELELARQRAEGDRLRAELEQERSKSVQLEQELAQQPQGPANVASLINPPADIAALNTGQDPSNGFGGARSFNLISPAGTAIETDHPTFRWQTSPLANTYKVKVLSGDNVVGTSDSLTETEWKMTQALERGKVYSWEVTAVNRENQEIATSNVGKFKVLEASKTDFLQRAKKEYGNDHIVLGVIYAQSGLLDDAERELDAATASKDTQSLARQLLIRVKAVRKSKGFAR